MPTPGCQKQNYTVTHTHRKKMHLDTMQMVYLKGVVDYDFTFLILDGV